MWDSCNRVKWRDRGDLRIQALGPKNSQHFPWVEVQTRISGSFGLASLAQFLYTRAEVEFERLHSQEPGWDA